jgi:transposase
MNIELFYQYLEITLPKLPLGSYLIWDNIAFHRSKKILKLVEGMGHFVLFLSPYSPNKNPIEHLWFHFKLWILKLATSCLDFFGKVSMAFKLMM